MTGIVTASWISVTLSGSAIRATPPCARMSAGTRSRAMTATAPASSAMRACSAVTTSMMTPPFSISARPRFTRLEPVCEVAAGAGTEASVMGSILIVGTDAAVAAMSCAAARTGRDVQRRRPEVSGRPGLGELLPDLAQEARQRLRARDDREEVGVERPPRHDVLVQVLGDAGAGDAALVHADVEAV